MVRDIRQKNNVRFYLESCGTKISRKFCICLFLLSFLFVCPAIYAATLVKNADIVTGNITPGTGTVIFNNGNGTFTPQMPDLGVGNLPTFVSVGDFNEDDIADLVFANGGSGGDHTLSFLLGKGDGTFDPRYTFLLGYEASNGIGIGDFNKDGHQDLFVPNWSPGGASSNPHR